MNIMGIATIALRNFVQCECEELICSHSLDKCIVKKVIINPSFQQFWRRNGDYETFITRLKNEFFKFAQKLESQMSKGVKHLYLTPWPLST